MDVIKNLKGGIKLLSKLTKVTQKQIKFDMHYICNYKSNKSDMTSCVVNTLSYLNSFDCDGWLSDIDDKKVAVGLYLTLTTWNDEFGKRYKGETSSVRQNFIKNI